MDLQTQLKAQIREASHAEIELGTYEENLHSFVITFW
jgi:hypothetical protein